MRTPSRAPGQEHLQSDLNRLTRRENPSSSRKGESSAAATFVACDTVKVCLTMRPSRVLLVPEQGRLACATGLHATDNRRSPAVLPELRHSDPASRYDSGGSFTVGGCERRSNTRRTRCTPSSKYTGR